MWSDRLTNAQISASGLLFQSMEEEASAVLSGQPFAAALTRFGLIKVEGEDAEAFLQGQVTCDMAQVTESHPKAGAHCNIKGRTQTTFIAAFLNNNYYLILPADQVEPTLNALRKFAMFSKASLSASDDYLLVGLGGNNPEGAIDPVWGPMPPPDHATLNDTGALLHLSCGHLIGLISPDKAQQFAASCVHANIQLCGDNAWQLYSINSGVVQIVNAQSEQWIPQEINYDLINGVSFKKGCYKGQEIIARIHYRGQTKVRTAALEISDCIAINVGDKIFSAAGAGTALATAQVNSHTARVLCTLKTEQSESQNLKLERNPDCQIRPLPLPYAIT